MYRISVIIQIVKTETHSLILHLSATCMGTTASKKLTFKKKRKKEKTLFFYLDLTSCIIRSEH